MEAQKKTERRVSPAPRRAESAFGELVCLTDIKKKAILDFIKANHLTVRGLALGCDMVYDTMRRLIRGDRVYPDTMDRFTDAMRQFGFDFNSLTWRKTNALHRLKVDAELLELEKRYKMRKAKNSPQIIQTLCWDCKHAWALGCQRFRDKEYNSVVDGSEYILVKHVDTQVRMECICVLRCPQFERGRAPHKVR